MFFLTFNNINIQFDKKSFTLKIYTTTDTLFMTKYVEFIDKSKGIKVI